MVRQSLRASVESYTLKQLEALYGFARAMEPRRAALGMQRYGFWLETGEALSDLEEQRAVLARYNEEDCRSPGTCATGWRSGGRNSSASPGAR